LHMIDNAIVLDIGVESGNHSLSEPSAVAPGDLLQQRFLSN
jgi:hypothetical protein